MRPGPVRSPSTRKKMVRLVGLEPTLRLGKRILNPSRLPIPPQPQNAHSPSGGARHAVWGRFGLAVAAAGNSIAAAAASIEADVLGALGAIVARLPDSINPIIGGYVGAYRAIRQVWSAFPTTMGDIIGTKQDTDIAVKSWNLALSGATWTAGLTMLGQVPPQLLRHTFFGIDVAIDRTIPRFPFAHIADPERAVTICFSKTARAGLCGICEG